MTEIQKKRLFLVLGMHRSGTSAIARGLMTLGAELGNHLLGPIRSDNEKGFFEDLDIQALNDLILRHFGRDWHSMAPIPAADFAGLPEPFFQHAKRLLAEKTGPFAVFAFKDPRVVRLLPFWNRVLADFDGEVSCVIALRHPLSAAQSLKKRNGMPIIKGLYLWLLHTLPALTSANPAWRKIVVDYDALMAAPEAQLARVATAFGVQPATPEALKSYTEEFLEDGMRHSHFDQGALAAQEQLPADLVETYTRAGQLARDEASLDDPAMMSALQALRARAEAAAAPRDGGKVIDLPALVVKTASGDRKLEYRREPNDEPAVADTFQNGHLNLAALPRIGELVAYAQAQRAAGLRPLIVDANAGIGIATVYLAQLFPDAQFVSIEPDFANFELLCRNVAGLDVTPLHGSIGHGISVDQILQRRKGENFPFLLHLDLAGTEKALFAATPAWLRPFSLIAFKPSDGALQRSASARPFLLALGTMERDTAVHADKIYSISNSI